MNADVAYAYLEEMQDYFEDRQDCDDGQPSKEMKLMHKCEEVLKWLETL